MTDQPLGVLHLVDTLEPGGTERVAVTLVNHLRRDRYTPYLCSTRRDGSLADSVDAGVGRLRLNRRSTFDVGALIRLVRYIREKRISILHAHGTTIFLARIAAMFRPRPALIWHTHYGRLALENRRAPAYTMASRGINGVIVVNRQLEAWCHNMLGIPRAHVWYVPNPIAPWNPVEKAVALPGTAGSRIVCVANIRPEKDHLTLVRSMVRVVADVPQAHLLLAGLSIDPELFRRVQSEIKNLGMESHISYLGPRQDVQTILEACDIGVLSSVSEGLPMALLEYGQAGLATVSTAVGQCEDVLLGGRAGILVPPGSEIEMASALISLLRDPDLRAHIGARFRQRVADSFQVTEVAAHIDRIYQASLATSREREMVESR